MQIESHATPYGGTPQQRYATLHRAIEQGLDSDDVWRELADVSLKLGHHGEAVRCARRIRNNAERHALEYKLSRLGLMPRPGDPVPAPADGEKVVVGPGKREHDGNPGLVEHLIDAGQYLMHQQMPWLVLTTMLAFPIVIGIGGFLTAGGSLLLLAAISALPGLCVLAVIAAMGRRILLTSAAGESDVPELPEFGKLLVEARRFGVDAVLVLGLFFGPLAAAVWLGAPWMVTGPLFAGAALLAPIAFAVREIRGDMRSFAPGLLLRAMHGCGRAYPVLAAVTLALFLPAVLVGCAVVARPVWVQIALIGPLCVLPIFLTTRLLGSWLDTRRLHLGEVLNGMLRERTKQRKQAKDGKAGNQKSRFPRRPDALKTFRAPVGKRIKVRTTGAQPQQPASALQRPSVPDRPAQPQRRRPGQLGKRPPARAIEGRRPQPRPAPPPPAPPQAPPPDPRAQLNEGPDLANIPGAFMVSGEERVRRGAAARPR